MQNSLHWPVHMDKPRLILNKWLMQISCPSQPEDKPSFPYVKDVDYSEGNCAEEELLFASTLVIISSIIPRSNHSACMDLCCVRACTMILMLSYAGTTTRKCRNNRMFLGQDQTSTQRKDFRSVSVIHMSRFPLM